MWDAADETPFLRTVARRAREDLGLRRDEGYHVVGRIPVFGSDHRAFAPPACRRTGSRWCPSREAEALRAVRLQPGAQRAACTLIRRPVPFDTYHTPRDRGATLEPARARRSSRRALEAVIAEVA